MCPRQGDTFCFKNSSPHAETSPDYKIKFLIHFVLISKRICDIIWNGDFFKSLTIRLITARDMWSFSLLIVFELNMLKKELANQISGWVVFASLMRQMTVNLSLAQKCAKMPHHLNICFLQLRQQSLYPIGDLKLWDTFCKVTHSISDFRSHRKSERFCCQIVNIRLPAEMFSVWSNLLEENNVWVCEKENGEKKEDPPRAPSYQEPHFPSLVAA